MRANAPSEISHLDTVGGTDEHATPENCEQKQAKNISTLSVLIHTGVRELVEVALLLLLLTTLCIWITYDKRRKDIFENKIGQPKLKNLSVNAPISTSFSSSSCFRMHDMVGDSNNSFYGTTHNKRD